MAKQTLHIPLFLLASCDSDHDSETVVSKRLLLLFYVYCYYFNLRASEKHCLVVENCQFTGKIPVCLTVSMALEQASAMT